jgi:GT2 family glycosyltransferase
MVSSRGSAEQSVAAGTAHLATPKQELSVFLGAPNLSIVIVSWNTCDMLSNCLKSLYEHFPKAFTFEVIVVDNASSDLTRSVIPYEFPQISYVQNGQNIGFSAANNIGIKHARGRYILLLNPDTFFTGNCISPILFSMTADSSIGLCACRLNNADGSLQRSADLFPVPFHELNPAFARKRSELTRQIEAAVETRTSVDVGTVVGAFQMISREILIRVGMLDEDLFMYGEDLDLCYSIHRGGKRIVYDASTSIIHLGGQSSDQIWSDSERLTRVRESIVRLHRKHFGPLAAAATLTVRTALSWMRLISVLALSSSSERKQSYFAEAKANARVLLRFPEIIVARNHSRS